MAGFAVGLCIGTMSAIGYRNTASPTLLRLSLAFILISVGFLAVWVGYALGLLPSDVNRSGWWLETISVGVQTLGYFFIALSHGLKSFFPKSRYLRGVAVFPLFLVSSVQLNHLLRSFSFILLVYAAIETILSFVESRNRGAVSVATGLAMLAVGEFMGWYSAVFPESLMYPASLVIKMAGLVALFLPVSRIPLQRIRFDTE